MSAHRVRVRLGGYHPHYGIIWVVTFETMIDTIPQYGATWYLGDLPMKAKFEHKTDLDGLILIRATVEGPHSDLDWAMPRLVSLANAGQITNLTGTHGVTFEQAPPPPLGIALTYEHYRDGQLVERRVDEF